MTDVSAAGSRGHSPHVWLLCVASRACIRHGLDTMQCTGAPWDGDAIHCRCTAKCNAVHACAMGWGCNAVRERTSLLLPGRSTSGWHTTRSKKHGRALLALRRCRCGELRVQDGGHYKTCFMVLLCVRGWDVGGIRPNVPLVTLFSHGGTAGVLSRGGRAHARFWGAGPGPCRPCFRTPAAPPPCPKSSQTALGTHRSQRHSGGSLLLISVRHAGLTSVQMGVPSLLS